MSKLHKTTYPSRRHNFNNFPNSASGSREVTKQNAIKFLTINKKQENELHTSSKLEEKNYLRHIQKKIQIDPSLLFNGKKNTRNLTRQVQNGPKITMNTSQCKSCQDSFHKQRPKSKQQSRVKINLDPDLKCKAMLNERPLTSKVPRPYKYIENVKMRKTTFQTNEDSPTKFKDIDRGPRIASSQSRRPSKTSKHNFQTLIDPQFLNLFAVS